MMKVDAMDVNLTLIQKHATNANTIRGERMKIELDKGKVIEWECDKVFTITFHVTSEEDRSNLLDMMRDRADIKITIEDE